MEKIIYREIETPFGPMLAGSTDRGLCLLEFKDRGGIDRIKARMLKRYGMEMQDGSNGVIDQIGNELERYFKGELKNFSTPLDIKGTPFQRSVWEELRKIPYGETRAYSEIARYVNKPKAVRAVGRSNGENYIAIVIPCHRVIEAGGSLRGYGGGLWRKQYLLDLEKGNPTKSKKPFKGG